MQKESLQQSLFSRPLSADRIQYLFIGKRPSYINYEAPEMFRSECLDMLSFLPKSIIQLVEPLDWHIENAKNFNSSHTDFGVLFDDYPIESYDQWFNSPCGIIVIFLNSHNDLIFKKIEQLNRFFLISSDDKDTYSRIRASHKLGSYSFKGSQQLFRKMLKFTLNELSIDPQKFSESRKKRTEKVREILHGVGFTELPDFLAARNNIANIHQILSLGDFEILKGKKVEHKDRVNELLNTSFVLGILSQRLRANDEKKWSNSPKFPTTILSFPFFNPDYKELLTRLDGGNRDNERLVRKQLKKFRFLEQDIDTYDFFLEQETPDSKIDFELFAAVGAAKKQHILFLDFVGYLHSSFELSPYIRVPARGASLNTYVSRLSPSQYNKSQNSRTFAKNITQIGKALSNNLPSKVTSFIDEFSDCIFAISDLPLEWALIQDVPLAFLCDVCRVPETPLTGILSQFNTNKTLSFQISEDILENTLVVCGVLPQDPIFKAYQYQITRNLEEGKLQYKTAHIQSKNEFFELVNKTKPQFLIIDSHGDFKKQSEGSYIWFGNEKVTGNDIVENLPLIPLVVLSCCWGTPIYGNSNTIAQAFFQQGSFSVLSTFLPISVTSGFTLYFRLLNNLSYAVKHGIHENWANFVSHNIRTSYISDLVTPIAEKLGSGVLDQERYTKLFSDWTLKCMHRQTRRNAYQEAKDMVLGSVKDSHRSRVERLLSSGDLTPEFMLYTHLGLVM